MNDITNDAPNELDTLKERATTMGIKFHPSISIDKLRDKVNVALQPTEEVAPISKKAAVIKARNEASAQIRVNVVCMNPAKKEWQGEIFITGNTRIGTFKKYVLFDTTDGYHVPKIIYDLLKAKKFQMFKTETTRNGVAKRVGILANEFAIETLPQLTETELADLAKQQAARG
jgi:hypothetical protein